MHTGWFKFHRQIFDNPICTKDAEYFYVWCYLLTEANYEERRVIFKGEEIFLKKGQLITSTRKIASDLNINKSKIERILKKFEIETQIETQKTSRNTLITVLNWEHFQGSETQSETQVRHKWDTSETLNGESSYYIKEIKNKRNKEKNKYVCAFEEFWKIYPRKINKGKAYECYCARVNSGYSEAELLEAVRNYADECKKKGTPTEYIKHGTTFLSAATPFVDYLDKNYKGGSNGCNRQDNRQSDGGYSDYEKFFREAH